MTSRWKSSRNSASAPVHRFPSPAPRLASSPVDLRLSELREHFFVLAENHVPPVVLAHILPAIGAHGGAQPVIGDQQLQTLRELVAVGVEQAGIAAVAVVDQH